MPPPIIRGFNSVHGYPEKLHENHYDELHGEPASLANELQETFRRLVQHLIFAALFTLRLYMLPLLYACHRLSRPEDIVYLSAWNRIFRSRITTHTRSTHAIRPGPLMLKVIGLMRSSITVPYNMIKTLYLLTNLVNQRTNPPLPSGAAQLEDEDSKAILPNPGKVPPLPSLPIYSPVEKCAGGGARASQIYRATRSNGNTLDDILAAFEMAETKMGGSDLSRNNSTSTDHPLRDLHHSNSSIQTTPERMQTPIKTEKTSILNTGPPLETNELRTIPSDHPARAPVTALTNVPIDPNRPQLQRSTSCFTPVTNTITEDCHPVEDPMKHIEPGLKRCPTFLRRHPNSRLPRKKLSLDNVSSLVHGERFSLAKEAHPLSPTRRMRVQRRLQVYRD